MMTVGVPTASTPWRLPLLTLALTLGLLLALTADTAVTMVLLWQAATTYNHCFLVLPIALVLIWMKRAQLAALMPRHEPLALIALLGFAFLWLIGRAGQIQLFEHLALVGMAISVIIALLGRQIARTIAFPLAFLFFMVPFGDVFVPALQQFTANFSVALLRVADIPVFHDGIMIETPSGLFEVAEACAGIRFLIANVMVGALFAYLALTRPWKWVLFMALAVVLPIVANGLRAFGIILIAYLTDNQYAAGVDHLVYGWGFFAAVMLAFLAIGNTIADPSADPSTDGGVDGFAGAFIGYVWRPVLALPVVALIAAAPLYAKLVLEQGPREIAIDPKLMLDPTLALDLGPACKADHAPADGWRPRFERADMTQGLTIDCGGQPVDLFLAYYAHEREGAELVHHANRLADGESWTRTNATWHAADIDGLPPALKKEELFGRAAGDRVVLAWYWIGGRPVASDWQAKAYRLYRKLLGVDEPAALIALSAPYSDRPDDALPDIEAVLEQHKGIANYLADLAPKAR
ncbi:MAG: exosortase A [Alphaproteobacteria bacterium]|nr:exosortase A [Alphaproteobacteria bacterium]